MSKFPEYKHDKGREYFDRALKVIPAGIYPRSLRGSLDSDKQVALLLGKGSGLIFLGR